MTELDTAADDEDFIDELSDEALDREEGGFRLITGTGAACR